MGFEDLVTKEDLKVLLNELRVLSSAGQTSWPMRMKKKTAAKYMDTSINQIDNWVNRGFLRPLHDKDPELHPTTPAYFNREDLDKIRTSRLIKTFE